MAVRTHSAGLNRETRVLLEYIGRARPANRAYGLPVEVAKAQAHAALDRVVNSCGLNHCTVNGLRWFIEDAAQALCFGQGDTLVLELEGILHKWIVFNLESNTLQLLMRILLREMAGIVMPEGQTKSEARSQMSEVRSDGGERTGKRIIPVPYRRMSRGVSQQ